MRILLLSQYYPPETGACANRIAGFARNLAFLGHEVHVVTGFPNYPTSSLYPGYSRSWCKQDRDGKVRLWRTWLSIKYPKHARHRLLNYLSFFVSSLWASFFRVPQPDIIIATSGPILVGFAGALVSKIRKAPLVLDLRDVWPERIVAAGEFRNPIALKALEWIEAFIYKAAHKIICVTQGLSKNLVQKGLAPDKLAVITNGTDSELFSKSKDIDPLTDYGITQDDFVIVYAGTLGLLQDHELILQSAEALKEYKDIKFVLIGDGVKKAQILHEAISRNLKNVTLLPNQNREKLASILRRASIGINTNTNIPHNEMAIPVKMFDYMACEVPVVMANNGEVAKLIKDWGVGYCTLPGKSEAFTQAILDMRSSKTMREKMGRHAREIIDEHFSYQVLTNKLELTLRSVYQKEIGHTRPKGI